MSETRYLLLMKTFWKSENFTCLNLYPPKITPSENVLMKGIGVKIYFLENLNFSVEFEPPKGDGNM